jgi:hypothetical protein
MIGDRDADRSTDVGAIWFGHGVDLAERVEAFIANWRDLPVVDRVGLLDDLEALLRADFDPRPGRRPQLGDPPTLRAAVPPNSHPGRGNAEEPGS